MNSSNEKIFDALTEIRADFIDEAVSHDFGVSTIREVRRATAGWYGFAAALLIMVVGAGAAGLWLNYNAGGPLEIESPTTSAVITTVTEESVGDGVLTAPTNPATTTDEPATTVGEVVLAVPSATTVEVIGIAEPPVITTAPKRTSLPHIATTNPPKTTAPPRTTTSRVMTTTGGTIWTQPPPTTTTPERTRAPVTTTTPRTTTAPQTTQIHPINLFEQQILNMSDEEFLGIRWVNNNLNLYTPDDFGVPLSTHGVFFIASELLYNPSTDSYYSNISASSYENARQIAASQYSLLLPTAYNTNQGMIFVGENDYYYSFRHPNRVERLLVFKESALVRATGSASDGTAVWGYVINSPPSIKTVTDFIDLIFVRSRDGVLYRTVEETDTHFIYTLYYRNRPVGEDNRLMVYRQQYFMDKSNPFFYFDWNVTEIRSVEIPHRPQSDWCIH